jgi:hypothetical protein
VHSMVNSGLGLVMNSARIKIGLRPETVIFYDIYENCEHGKTRTRYHTPCMNDGAHLAVQHLWKMRERENRIHKVIL